MDNRNLRGWEDEPKYSFKIIVLGSKSVGKSSLLKRFQFDEFEDVPSHTIGVGFSTHNIKIGINSVQVAKIVYVVLLVCSIFQEFVVTVCRFN